MACEIWTSTNRKEEKSAFFMDIAQSAGNPVLTGHSFNIHSRTPRRCKHASGAAYFASCLKFVERARSEWLRALDFEQDVLRNEHGGVFVVRRVEADYLSPAHFNNALDASVSLKHIADCRARDAGMRRCSTFQTR
jgi:hypothetical protein